MSNKIIIAILASFALMGTAFADNHEGGEGGDKKPFVINGDFAGSVGFMSNGDLPQPIPAAGDNNNHGDFMIDLAEVNVHKHWSHSHLQLSLGYGNTFANALSGTQTNTLNLTNAFYEMTSSYGVGFIFGKMSDIFGYERYNHLNNRQYTRSYAYNNTPHIHTGLGITYNWNDMVKAAVYHDNGQAADRDGDKYKHTGITVDIMPMEGLHIDLNYLAGASGTNDNTWMEVGAAYTINEMFDVALQYWALSTEPMAGGTKTDANSIAAYVNFTAGMYGAALRYEMVANEDQIITPAFSGTNPGAGSAGNDITSLTLALHADIDENARVLFEYRMDSADDQGSWNDEKGVANKKDINQMLLGLMYRF